MSPAPQPTAADKSNRRTMIATEILTTERTYVEGLTWLIDDYKATMLKLCAEPHTGVTDAVIKKVFSNLEVPILPPSPPPVSWFECVRDAVPNHMRACSSVAMSVWRVSENRSSRS
jgi:hypothetical protein